MREYYVFLSSGIRIDTPVWTEPYIDAWIEEEIISAVLPVYYQEENATGIPILLGVAVVDVKMSYYA